MARFDAVIASPATSAGAFIVTTVDALLYGICASGSAVATFIDVHKGVNTAGGKVFALSVASVDVSNDGPYAPIVCAGGITATNIGTVASYIVYYTNL